MAVATPYAIYRFYVGATVAKDGTIEIVTGTVRLSRQGSTNDVAANNGDTVLEGYTVTTDNNARALLTLFDGSTVYIFENTQLYIKSLRTSRFTRNNTIIVLTERQGTLGEQQGRLRVGVAPPTTRDQTFVVVTPQSSIDLQDGSYAIEVGAQGTTISVRAGIGVVTAARSAVTIKRGQRSTVAVGQPPSAPAPAALDLVVNGDFQQRDVGWTLKADVEAGRRDDIYGQTVFATDPTGTGVRFVRRGSKNSHGENSVYQAINRDVSDYVSLKLSVDFKLIYQSLSGGGYLGSEYPIIVRITYRDANGAQYLWSHGFYYQNDAGYPTTYGEQVPAEVWIPYEKDLFALEGYPKPFRLLSVEVAASGWDYESLLNMVSILAE